MIFASMADHLERFVDRRRLLSIAERLIASPSPTGRAGDAANVLAAILADEGFVVDRPEAGHPKAPAVVARLSAASPGRTLQFEGHLDTVHLPFVPPAVVGDHLTGSGASDMKGGLAAAVEAMLAVRDSGALAAGTILLTAHDLHESPWGHGEQLDHMIDEGMIGDAVLIPEPLGDRLPIAGRGLACWEAVIHRPGPPIHEVLRPTNEPSVIKVGAELVLQLARLDDRLAAEVHPIAGRASTFVGQIHAGDIYNGFPKVCRLEGTRRWIPGTDAAAVEREFRALADEVARDSGAELDLNFRLVRDAFTLDPAHPFVGIFQEAHQVISGRTLPTGPKPIVDDGNTFFARARIPAITHGPRAGGQHTVEEWASINDLVRLAKLYALVAVVFGPSDPDAVA